MCGITGAIWLEQQHAIDEPTLARMTECLRHRGPDDAGSHTTDLKLRSPYEPMPGVALGQRRLSIIDLAGGHQPMSNEDGSIWVVCNGEIYNYRALRLRLEGSGHAFRTECDTEVIAHLYEDTGPACFEHLSGMFAIAIWDSRRRQLVLGRDRLGQKPLVYRHEKNRLLFASELKSILQAPGVPREIDPAAVDEYLTYQYVPHPNTILKGIRKLPPGHRAVWLEGKLTVEPYWSALPAMEHPLSEAEAVHRVAEHLRSSVEMRLMSDVPLGAFLSGGVDSSLIAALMTEISGGPIQTFSIGFPQPKYDETQYARQVAAHLGSEHHEEQVTPDAVAILPKLVWHFDEPFGDSSAVPTWYLAQMTRQHVTVALSGDGGDELFAGYDRYHAVKLGERLDKLPASWLRGAAWLAERCVPESAKQRSLRRRLRRFTAAVTLPPARRYLEWIAIFHESQRADLYTEEFVESLPGADPAAFLTTAWERVGKRDAMTCASLADLVTYLPCDLMTKVDIATMAHGLECRQPFLDHHLVELAAGLPIGLKYRQGRGKRILKKAFGPLLPAEIWKRRKMGFGVPLDSWFRGELKPLTHDVLLDGRLAGRGIFRQEMIEQLATQHEQNVFDHSYRLWSLLVLEMWLREWVDG